MAIKVLTINEIYKKLQVEEQQLLNIHLSHYNNLAMNIYEWENLPTGMESRHIEKALLNQGQAFFYDDEVLGLICLPCSNSQNMNIYGEPTSLMITGHGYSKQKRVEDGVRILNNPTCTPTNTTLNYYCMKLAQIDSTMNTNLIQQKVPFIFATTKENELTLKNLYAKMYSGEPAIFVNKEMLNEKGDLKVQAISCEAPYLVDKLQQHRFEVEKELLSFLGVNSTVEKKERLIVDETNANNELISLNVEIGLRERQLACEKINDRYGLDIKVSAKKLEGVLFDGELYNRDTNTIE